MYCIYVVCFCFGTETPFPVSPFCDTKPVLWINGHMCPTPWSVWRSVSSTVTFYLMRLPGWLWRKCYENKTRHAQFHLWLGMVILRGVTGFHLTFRPAQIVVLTERVWFYIRLRFSLGNLQFCLCSIVMTLYESNYTSYVERCVWHQ